MLISQFDKFVNRSTREILGSEIEQENLEPMLSTDINRNGGAVTGVKGENEVYYRTGNVNLTSADIGALDEDNVYNGLDKAEAGYALDARQGKALNEAIGDKLDKANVYNGLDQTNSGYALDARQGKVLGDSIDDKLDKANVYNGLDQTNSGYALDARQGKVMNDKINTIQQTLATFKPGDNYFEKVFAVGYTTGSGNYFDFFIPGNTSQIASVTSVTCLTGSACMKASGGRIDIGGTLNIVPESTVISPAGIVLEVRFASTQTANMLICVILADLHIVCT